MIGRKLAIIALLFIPMILIGVKNNNAKEEVVKPIVNTSDKNNEDDGKDEESEQLKAEQLMKLAEERVRDNSRFEIETKEKDEVYMASRGKVMSVPKTNTSMKTYMDYRKITDKSSKQYKLQQRDDVYTDSEGFRKIEDSFLVAVGSYYGSVGDELQIELSNGTVFKAIIGDVKADIHTDSTNRQHKIDHSVVEFIVDTSKLPIMIKKMGDCSYSDKYNLKGDIVNIIAFNQYQ